jgi:hypothetical protein
VVRQGEKVSLFPSLIAFVVNNVLCIYCVLCVSCCFCVCFVYALCVSSNHLVDEFVVHRVSYGACLWIGS